MGYLFEIDSRLAKIFIKASVEANPDNQALRDIYELMA